jgi:amino acid adenylation domain-containing protein
MSLGNTLDFYPLSPLQHGLLFHSLPRTTSGLYVIQISCVLEGDFNIGDFERTWAKLIQRHEAFRTFFVWEGLKSPIQVVEHEAALDLRLFNRRDLSGAQQEEFVEALLESDREEPFDLAKPPLMRVLLVELGDRRHHLIWSVHHLIIDGWAINLVLKELLRIYASYRGNDEPDLPLPRPYRDFIAWLEKQDVNEAEDYWRRNLRGLTELSAFPRNGLTAKSQSLGRIRGRESVKLSREWTERLRSFARKNRLTVNTVVQGAWSMLVSRYSNRRDIVIGNVVLGRPPQLRGSDSMIGLFINTVPIRVDASPATSLNSFLMAIQSSQLEASQYGYCRLGRIQQLAESAGGQLFDHAIAFEASSLPESISQGGESKIAAGNLRSIERPHYALNLQASVDGVFELTIIYDASAFERATILRILNHFETILQNILVAPADLLLVAVEMLAPPEIHQTLAEWNDTAREEEVAPVTVVLEDKARCAPDVLALSVGDCGLTYGELNRRANQLAHRLRSLGIGPEVRVAVWLERGLELIQGILGILKSGGAYVPLDLGYPLERIAFMLRDSRAVAVITKDSLIEHLPGDSVQAISLDSEWDLISLSSDSNPPEQPVPDSLAYVIYTSGSTGTPKAVSVSHRNLIYSTLARTWHYPDRVKCFLLLAPISFDSSVAGIFWTLSQAGLLLLTEEGSRTDTQHLTRLINDRRVSHFTSVPSFHALLLERAVRNPFQSLQIVIVAGESCGLDLAARHRAILPQTVLFNEYGPTEGTVWCTTYRCPPPEGATDQVPIGYPIENARVYLLDETWRPVPATVPGEAYVGGTGLARGYLNDPRLTAEKFLPNPFDGTRGGRLYKTGDVAVQARSGVLEFRGRIDNQVKIRGNRVEIGEIENAVKRHPNVADAIVLAKGERAEKQLIAYFVPRTSPPPTADELRRRLRDELPDFMVPFGYRSLGDLPLMANGKIDRSELLAMDARGDWDLERTYVQPATEVEKKIAEIWQEVLELDAVGLDNNFFDLGGHSLLLARVHKRLEETFDRDVELEDLFNYPTVRLLAAFIAHGHSAESTIRDVTERIEGQRDAVSRQRQRMKEAGAKR